MHRASLPLLLLLTLLLGGCRFEVAGELEIARNGTATLQLLLRLDPAALEELDELGVDPTAELAAVAGQAPDWQVTRTTEDDGALAVRLTRTTSDVGEAADALRELTAGLAPNDPALVVDLDLEVDAEGAVDLEGTAEFRPPTSPGVTLDGSPVGPDARALERLTREAVGARFTVAVPGGLVEHDADLVDGRTATWELGPGEQREVRLVAAAPTQAEGWLLVAAAAALVVLATVLLVWWWRRPR